MTPKSKKKNLKKPLPKFWTERELALFFSFIRNERDLLIVHLIAFCGLRTIELLNLKLKDINLKNRSIRIRNSKFWKGRVVPFDDRVQAVLSSFLKKWPRTPGELMFQSFKISRDALTVHRISDIVHRAANEARLSNGSVDTLRHTYGIRLAAGGETIKRIVELMGFKCARVAYKYRKLSGLYKTHTIRKADLRSRLGGLWYRLVEGRFSEKTIKFAGMKYPDSYKCRRTELLRLKNNLAKGIDTLIIGSPGVGKSHLLNELRSPKIIRISRFVPLKLSVLTVAEVLHSNGVLKSGCENPENWAEVKRAHSKATVRQWCLMILSSVEKGEWILLIDDMTDLTKIAVDALNMLSKEFVIFGAVREIKKSLSPFFWKYDKIELGSLTRGEARELIRHLSGGGVFEDYELFESCVLVRSYCNPRAICEIIERARKEQVITIKYSRDIEYSGAVKKIDLSPVFVILAALFIASRFIARGVGNMEVYMFTGVGGALFMVLRMFTYRTRR